MPISGVRTVGGPEYQFPSQETLVLAKAAVRVSSSVPLTMIPRFALFAPPAALGAVADVAAAVTDEGLEGATTGAAATTEGDVLELGSAPTTASVMAVFAAGNGELELVSVGEAVLDSTEEELPASTGTGLWVGTGA